MGRKAAVRVAVAVGMAVAAFSFASDASAQDGWSVNRASGMEDQARELADTRDDWTRAAWLYRSAASLRPAGDLVAVEDLEMAARLSWYTLDASRALSDLELAAERAMEGGDVFTAARLLMDAAWVAARSGRHEEVRSLTDRALAHADSPLLSDQVRRLVTDRVIDLSARTQVVAAR